MLDIEWPWSGSGSPSPCYGLSPSQMVSWIRDFLDRVRERTGYPTGLVQEMVSGIRNIKSEYNVAVTKEIEAIINVPADSDGIAEALAAHLWTYRPESFLPREALRWPRIRGSRGFSDPPR